MVQIDDITGIGPTKAEKLEDNGFESVEDVAEADPADLEEISGISEDRALEYMVSAGDLLDDESSEEGEEFDLTPSEVSDELKDSDESSDASETDEEPDDESASTFDVTLSFEEKIEYDVYHAALMRQLETVYTSNQPAADAIQGFLDELDDFNSVSYELTEYELNTLHTAVKQTRSEYQGNNLIDQMDALNKVEDQVDEARQEHLF